MSGWYCQHAGQISGPFSLEELLFLRNRGKLNSADLVRDGEQGGWVVAGTLSNLFPLAGGSGERPSSIPALNRNASTATRLAISGAIGPTATGKDAAGVAGPATRAASARGVSGAAVAAVSKLPGATDESAPDGGDSGSRRRHVLLGAGLGVGVAMLLLFLLMLLLADPDLPEGAGRGVAGGQGTGAGGHDGGGAETATATDPSSTTAGAAANEAGESTAPAGAAAAAVASKPESKTADESESDAVSQTALMTLNTVDETPRNPPKAGTKLAGGARGPTGDRRPQERGGQQQRQAEARARHVRGTAGGDAR